jgi:single-strand DNA-binding protein
MAGVNRVIIVGRLGQDPEVKYFQDGSAVCNFSVATSQEWKDKNTGEKKEKVEWHRIVAFRKLAELCGQYLAKGRQVFIDGRLQTRQWEKDGQNHYTTEIIANSIEFLGGRNGNASSDAPGAPEQNEPEAGPANPAPAPPQNFENDIPF